ncbi:chromosomal replication initiator protein DnaA [Clostridia bacterium]|nr:chromosomal replication initiator protein DnaA [Clostridia bacterium]
MSSNAEVYEKICEYLEKSGVTERAMNAFIRTMKLAYLDGSKAIIMPENIFKGNLVRDKYLELIREGFFHVLGFDVEVSIEYENVSNETVDKVNETIEIVAQKHIELENTYSNAKYEYTFATFIKGPSNDFALAASMSIIDKENLKNTQLKNNPLFIHGNSGLGKTHLMYAIANASIKQYPNMKVIYVSSETYGNEFIESISHNKTEEFRHKYRKADLLLLDDVQFFSEKVKTQEELFHTFNELYNSGRQIVLTSDKPAKDIKLLEDRIRSRFEWGLIAEILPPEKETRAAIIKRKAELLGLNIGDDVVDTLAEMIKTNIRQLESAVKKIKALEHFQQIQPNVAIAQGIAMDILRDEEFSPITVDKIIQKVADVYKITVADIRSSKRSKDISMARKISAYIIKEITTLSLKEIGEKLGNRDHSTMIYAITDIQNLITTDENTKNLISEMIKNIKSSLS